MYNMFLDDERNPVLIKSFDIVRSSDEAISHMQDKGCPRFISFDHDLGGDDTAMRVVHWMIDHDLELCGEWIPFDFSFYVHSQNPIGAENIANTLQRYLDFREANIK